MKQSNGAAPGVKLGWMLLVFGAVLLAAGAIYRQVTPDAAMIGKLVVSFGIFFAGWGLISLSRGLAALKDPQAARRMAIEEQDERNLAIRDRAGYGAYIFSAVAAAVGLIVYSWLSRDQPGFDPLWWYLAFLVIAPGLYYVIALVRLREQF